MPVHFRYKEYPKKMCTGHSYTDHKSTGCNGWAGISEVECQQHCSNNDVAPNCPNKKCMAAVFFSAGGWCHLYEPSECETQNSLEYALTYKKVEEGLFNNPAVNKVKKALSNPVTQKVLGAGAIAVGVGAAAAGVAAALHTRNVAPTTTTLALKPRIVSTAAPSTSSSTGDGLNLPQQRAAGFANQATLGPNSFAMTRGPGASTTAGASSFLSGPSSSSSGLPLWLPLVILCCCCLAAALTAIAMRSKRGGRGTRNYYEDDEDYEGEDYDNDQYGAD